MQLAEAVEHVKGVDALLGDHAPNRHRERLETLVRVELVDLQTLGWLEQRLMRGEPDVDEVAPIAQRLVDERFVEVLEIVKAGQLPDHVIAQTDVVIHGVERGDAGFDSIESSHGAPLGLRVFI